MTQLEKLLAQFRVHPRSVRFEDFVRALEAHGVTMREGKGSHVAARGGVVYTSKRPPPGQFVHPKSVKHCLHAFGLWD